MDSEIPRGEYSSPPPFEEGVVEGRAMGWGAEVDSRDHGISAGARPGMDSGDSGGGGAQLHPRVEGQSDGLELKGRHPLAGARSPAPPRRAQARRACSPRTAGRVGGCAHSARASTPSPVSKTSSSSGTRETARGWIRGDPGGGQLPPGIGGRAVGLRARGLEERHFGRRLHPGGHSPLPRRPRGCSRAWQGDGLQTQARGRVVVV